MKVCHLCTVGPLVRIHLVHTVEGLDSHLCMSDALRLMYSAVLSVASINKQVITWLSSTVDVIPLFFFQYCHFFATVGTCIIVVIV